jgi:putative CocE/NonD family hydrolase
VVTSRIDRDVDIPMRDGTILRADVWSFADDEQRPCVLWRTPYNRKRIGGDFFNPFSASEVGYCSVIQDVRGRFGSDGDWEVLQWEQEKLDTFDTVEWIAAQPWCDGNVVMSGASYLGQVQWLAAAAAPPHLRAIAPIVAGPNGDLDRIDTGGATRLVGLVAWLSMVGLDWINEEIVAGRLDASVLASYLPIVSDPMPAVEHLPLTKIPDFDIPGFPIDMDRLFAEGVDTLGTVDASEIGVPSLTITGWYEVLAYQSIENFVRMRARGAGDDATRRAHRIVIGPWTHNGPMAHCGELALGLAAHGQYAAQWSAKHQVFFDRHCRGGTTDLPVVEYYVVHDGWRTAEQWPPASATTREWFLSSGGAALTAAGDGALVEAQSDVVSGADVFDYDPADPSRTIGGRMLADFGPMLAGPFDQAANERRDDMVCYTSSPVDAPVDLVGPVDVELYASSSALDTDFVAKLTDVFPDGRSILVASGIRRARFRRDFEEPELLVPGQAERYELCLGHVGWRLLPGHRLRLSVTSSDFPRFDRNLNTGNPPGADAEGVVAHQSVLHDGRHPSVLRATVLAARA